MALKHPIKTTTNQPITASQSQTIPLPPPQTFDILPPLHELLARVDAYNNTTTANTIHEHDQERDEDIGAAYSELQPLNPKDFPTAVLEIKARVRAALREIEKLPEVERSVEEQEEEIAELQRRVVRQREMLRGLGVVAGAMERRVG